MVPHLIVFSEKNLQGRHWHIFADIPSIGDISFTWDDNISSFAVLAGQWQFFRGRNFADQLGQTIGPGAYASLADIGVSNDAISSIKLVG
jgi:beta/gamma crystallin